MGVTQSELAGYMGFNRMQLSYAESGQRDIPYEASTKWSVMRRCLKHDAEVGVIASSILQEEILPVAGVKAKYIRRLPYAIEACKKKLADMEERYAICIRMMALARRLREVEPDMDEDQLAWLKRMETRAAKRRWKYNPSKQAIVQLRLRSLELVLLENTIEP